MDTGAQVSAILLAQLLVPTGITTSLLYGGASLSVAGATFGFTVLLTGGLGWYVIVKHVIN